MENEREICTISIGDGFLDNDYTFFEGGTIRRNYDQNTFKYNLERWVKPDEISEHTKQRLLAKCKEEYRDFIQNVLYS